MKYFVTTNKWTGGVHIAKTMTQAKRMVKKLSGRGLNPRIRQIE